MDLFSVWIDGLKTVVALLRWVFGGRPPKAIEEVMEAFASL